MLLQIRRDEDGAPGRSAERSPEWEQAYQRLREIYQEPFHRPGTWRRHKYVLAMLEQYAERPGAITVDTIAALARDLLASGHVPAGVNSILRTARAQCYHFEDFDLLPASPFATRRGRRCRLFVHEPKGDPTLASARHHSIADMRTLFALADAEHAAAVGMQERFRTGRRRALLYLVAHCGLRKLEALRLRWQHVDTARGVIWVTETDGELKTAGSAGPVPLPNALAAVLEQWRPLSSGVFVFCQWRTDKPWTEGATKYRPTNDLAELGRRAGVNGLTLKSLRKTWATHAESAWGLSNDQARRVLRHTTEATGDYYRQADVDNLRAMAGRIDYGTPTHDAPVQ